LSAQGFPLSDEEPLTAEIVKQMIAADPGVALAKVALPPCVGLGWWVNEDSAFTIVPANRVLNEKKCVVARKTHAAMTETSAGITKSTFVTTKHGSRITK
jgi:hypothetical protein